jgi:hypothetical protein
LQIKIYQDNEIKELAKLVPILSTILGVAQSLCMVKNEANEILMHISPFEMTGAVDSFAEKKTQQGPVRPFGG